VGRGGGEEAAGRGEWEGSGEARVWDRCLLLYTWRRSGSQTLAGLPWSDRPTCLVGLRFNRAGSGRRTCRGVGLGNARGPCRSKKLGRGMAHGSRARWKTITAAENHSSCMHLFLLFC
jgi:hypothetical protein